jgi:hypothetical protein
MPDSDPKSGTGQPIDRDAQDERIQVGPTSDLPPAVRSDNLLADLEVNLLRFPQTVRVAGILWIVFGGLIVPQVVVGLMTSPVSTNVVLGGCCGVPVLTIGAACVWVGIQTVRGKASSMKGNDTGSIIFGVLNLCLGLALIDHDPVQGTLSLIAGCGLVTAGLFAMAGRYHYRVWFVANRRQGSFAPRSN